MPRSSAGGEPAGLRAAAIAGISRRTLHRELNRSVALGRQIDQAKDEAEAAVTDTVTDRLLIEPGVT
jgi:hypothetical protein